MGDVMYKVWASSTETQRVAEGDPLTRLRGRCPACGRRLLHLYPFLGSPRYEVFLHCACGYADFVNRDALVVRSAVPFEPRLFANGYFRGLARHAQRCSACGSTQTELLDTPDPNTAHVVCSRCGRVGLIVAPFRVERPTARKAEAHLVAGAPADVLPFRPASDSGPAACESDAPQPSRGPIDRRPPR